MVPSCMLAKEHVLWRALPISGVERQSAHVPQLAQGPLLHLQYALRCLCHAAGSELERAQALHVDVVVRRGKVLLRDLSSHHQRVGASCRLLIAVQPDGSVMPWCGQVARGVLKLG